MAPNPKFRFSDLAEYRQAKKQNQSMFWRRIGVTQACGSRYENGRNIPRSVKLLLVLDQMGVLTEKTLSEAKRIIERAS